MTTGSESLGVKTLAEDADVEYLFFVGCAGSYDQRYQKVSVAFAKLMREAGVKFGILDEEESCTGDSAKRMGNEMLAQQVATQNVEVTNGYGVKNRHGVLPMLQQYQERVSPGGRRL